MSAANKTLQSMTAAQTAKFMDTRANLFKGTIAVATIYATLCLGILLIAIFSPTGRSVLTESLFPFVVTFVIAMIVAVIFLVLQVMSWVPAAEDVMTNASSCPDYWNVGQTPPTTIQKMSSDKQGYPDLVCTPDATIGAGGSSGAVGIGTTTTATAGGGTVADDLILMTNSMNGTAGIGTDAMSCSKIYPHFMALWDAQYHPDAPNSIRCDWAKKCGVQWSQVCPGSY